jgi:hypothetical protein
MNDITAETFGNPESTGTLSWKQTLDFQARLEAWFQDLPHVLSPKTIVLPVQLKIQSVASFF